MPSYVRNTTDQGQWQGSHVNPQPQGHGQQQNNYQQSYSEPQYTQQQQQQDQYQSMSDQYQPPPKLGATFYPGGQDDFYMPEVVSPLPQRIMPDGKIEADMQHGLATLELEARNSPLTRMESVSSVSAASYEVGRPYRNNYDSNATLRQPEHGQLNSPQYPKPVTYHDLRDHLSQQRAARNLQESPKFSPFPKLRNPGKDVPLSDDDKEEVLDDARPLVLKSSDAELQLDWAQDALSWVEVASNHAVRAQDGGQPGRSITPKVEHQLRVDAVNIVQFLAEQSHPKAEFMKGMWLEFGKFGYRVDKKEAFLAYRRAAEKNYARAEYRIGMQFESSNNSAKAIEHYQRGSSQNDSASNYRLGMMTLLGQHGMPQDYQRGVDLIRFAAETADENAPQGAYVYGMLLARELPNISIPEQNLPFDLNSAKLYIEKAAYLGFAKAQLKMAQAYELCQLGLDFMPVLSLHYNALASRQGEAEADMAISKWFLCGFEDLFEKNEELAYTYAKRAAATKMATAEFAMGYFYEIGMYVLQDLRESESWYQKAAEHGNKDALGRIDSIKKNNTLSRKDHEQVAISRIKSQYGSQRGGRPDRFKQKPPPMPSMAEDRLDMPDPRKSYAGPPRQQLPIRPQSSNAPIIRPVSTAPYPEDDGPPKFRQQPKPAPYPNQGGLRPNPRPGPQADRPQSAFGIRPLTNADEYGTPNNVANQMRASTSMGNIQPAAGRGYIQPGGFQSQIPSKYRDSSSERQPTVPQVGISRPPISDQFGSGKVLPIAPLNVNKPQPPHPSTQGRPSSSHGPANPAANRKDPVPTGFIRPERGSSITPTGSQFPNSSPANSGPSRASQRTPTMQPPNYTMSSQSNAPRPHSAGKSSAASIAPSLASVASTGKSSAASTAPSTAPSTSTYTSAGPKKPGPSTFEEMGIPAGKRDSECVVM